MTYHIERQEHGECFDEIVVGPRLDQQLLRVEDAIDANSLDEQAPTVHWLTSVTPIVGYLHKEQAEANGEQPNEQRARLIGGLEGLQAELCLSDTYHGGMIDRVHHDRGVNEHNAHEHHNHEQRRRTLHHNGLAAERC